MTSNELEAVTLHEIGEFMASQELGEQWREMLINLPRSRAEFLARAVKDLLADCLSTLPGLIKNNNSASLHFYAANLVAMRKDLFPSFHAAYQIWAETKDSQPLKNLAAKGAQHWSTLAREMLNLYQKDKSLNLDELETLVENNTF